MLLDHHMQKYFHKPVLNTLLINILNQNCLQVSQQKKKKKKKEGLQVPYSNYFSKLLLNELK